LKKSLGEADNYSGGHEVPHPLHNREFPYHAQNSLPESPALRQLNQVHNCTHDKRNIINFMQKIN